MKIQNDLASIVIRHLSSTSNFKHIIHHSTSSSSSIGKNPKNNIPSLVLDMSANTPSKTQTKPHNLQITKKKTRKQKNNKRQKVAPFLLIIINCFLQHFLLVTSNTTNHPLGFGVHLAFFKSHSHNKKPGHKSRSQDIIHPHTK